MAIFGRAKYGAQNSTPSAQTISIKEGDNVYRFLPPMHSYADLGRWSNYVTVHFGYQGTDSNDAAKTRVKPFRCIKVEDRKTRMVIEDCPECTLYEQREHETQNREAALRAGGKSDDEIETVLGPIRGWLQKHNPDRKHYINAMKPDGTFCAVKISHRTKKQLDAKIKEMQDREGVDPLDPEQGVWFNIRRTGRFREAQDVVEVLMEDVEVEISGRKQRLKRVKMAPLTEEMATRASESCRDLAKIGGFDLTYAQIKMLAESSGDPEEVDQIFALTQRNEKSPVRTGPAFVAPPFVAPPFEAPPFEAPTPPPVAAPAPLFPAGVFSPPSDPAGSTTAPAEDDEEAALEAQMAALKASKAAKAAAKAAEAKAVSTASEAVLAPAPSAAAPDASFLEFFNSRVKS